MIPENETSNFETFRDCLSTSIIEKLAPVAPKTSRKRGGRGRKNDIKPTVPNPAEARHESDAAELADFVEYLAEELFTNQPADLRTLSYAVCQNQPDKAVRYATPLAPATLSALLQPLPPSIPDSLISAGILADATDLARFLEPVLTSYLETCTTPSSEYTPSVAASRPDGCEICLRAQLPLTYHHLIPRQMHAKAVKRGWCAEWEVRKVAWLCRACHSFVHRVASNEELAREWCSVEALMGREDVVKWAGWVGKVRWGAR